MLTTLEKIFFLKKVPMFADMSSDELRLISQLCTEHNIPDGEIIMNENTFSEYVYLYIVVEGVVSLSKKQEDGEEKLLKIVKPKEHFGEIEVFDEETMTASQTMKTMDKTRLLRIGQKEFYNLLLEYPRISLAICRAFSKKLQEINKLILLDY